MVDHLVFDEYAGPLVPLKQDSQQLDLIKKGSTQTLHEAAYLAIICSVCARRGGDGVVNGRYIAEEPSRRRYL